MAIKTFTSGEVLTAADTNTYLTNSGLVYITGGTLSGTNTNFVGCFTSSFRDYRIVISGGIIGAATDFCYQMLVGSTATVTNYWYAYTGYSGGGAAADQNGQNVAICRTGASAAGANDVFGLVMDFYTPQVASQFTFSTSQASCFQADDFRARSGGSGCNLTTQFDGIKFASAGGQAIGGVVKIYGYRQP
jgi:hypothetical protein